MPTRDSTMGFIGCGRVGRTLARALANAGYTVSAAWTRDREALQRFANEIPGVMPCGAAQDLVARCDFVWITVADDAIASVAQSLQWSPRHRVVHCSGATGLAALSKAMREGARTGGFHPLQMFANPEVALQGLPGCTVGIAADGDFAAELGDVATRLGCIPFRVPEGSRALYHASAYYVGPFLIALLREASLLWKSFGGTEQQTLDALLPLLAGTVAAVKDAGLAKGMGGCVARGDVGTVGKHLEALNELCTDAHAALYRELALRTVPMGLERGTLKPEGAARIQSVLREVPRKTNRARAYL
ncbi:hypothetical protein PMI15_03134 [Polaromonas sp. CF318]|uniref:Rossmann-like and DUF2520 domain-containing protein n=1 Tax=Polaromonas sp. CF318 TaxID=1144318 RepID=UPI000270F9C5|nr:DUF2520 domain-containing protein [Polaromonas sp. CF318]EJL82526.1 hypothetical protein PMI15_03134 [Polaromonas sp. CF318]